MNWRARNASLLELFPHIQWKYIYGLITSPIKIWWPIHKPIPVLGSIWKDIVGPEVWPGVSPACQEEHWFPVMDGTGILLPRILWHHCRTTAKPPLQCKTKRNCSASTDWFAGHVLLMTLQPEMLSWSQAPLSNTVGYSSSYEAVFPRVAPQVADRHWVENHILHSIGYVCVLSICPLSTTHKTWLALTCQVSLSAVKLRDSSWLTNKKTIESDRLCSMLKEKRIQNDDNNHRCCRLLILVCNQSSDSTFGMILF